MKSLEAEPPPIACTLGAGDMEQRLGWIAALNAASLRGHKRDDLRLRLSYEPDALEQVRELVRREEDCCAFLTFVVSEDASGVHLLIEAPEAARDAADMVFGPFVSGTPGQAVCACCAGGAS